MKTEKEKRLAAALKKGSVKALEKVIDTYSAYVCTVIRNFSHGTLTEDDIDEICSDVFFNVWQHREGLNPENGLRPYLSAAARNAVKNIFRTEKPDTLSDSDISEFEIEDQNKVYEQAELNEMILCLKNGLKELSERDREIFLLYYFLGKKAPEIAILTNLTEGSVRSVLSRTRKKLKDYLIERGCNYV